MSFAGILVSYLHIEKLQANLILQSQFADHSY